MIRKLLIPLFAVLLGLAACSPGGPDPETLTESETAPIAGPDPELTQFILRPEALVTAGLNADWELWEANELAAEPVPISTEVCGKSYTNQNPEHIEVLFGTPDGQYVVSQLILPAEGAAGPWLDLFDAVTDCAEVPLSKAEANVAGVDRFSAATGASTLGSEPVSQSTVVAAEHNGTFVVVNILTSDETPVPAAIAARLVELSLGTA